MCLGNMGGAGLPKPTAKRHAQALETCAQVASCATVSHCSVKQGAILGEIGHEVGVAVDAHEVGNDVL